MKKLKLGKKTKIIALALLLISVIVIIALLSIASLRGEEQALSTYTMDLSYNDSSHSLEGREEITYINNSDNMFEKLYLHLYPNAFREGAKNQIASTSAQDNLYVNGLSYGRIDIKSVTSEEENLTYSIEGEDQNLLAVTLPCQLYPDESITFAIEFTVNLANINHRLGYGNNAINFGNFYPIVCVYEEGEGFRCDLYHSNGDPFYSECANYKVNISYPSQFTLASSGEVISTVAEEDITNSHIKANNIRDFCFVLSEIFTVATTSVDGITINFYGYNLDEDLQTNLTTSAKAVATFNELFGKYPYSTLNVVKTNFIHGGMEYPNLVLISDSLSQEDLAYVIVHEIAHQWWYGVVGNDQYNHAWLDEGLAEYSTLLFFENNENYSVSTRELIDNAYQNYKTFTRVYSSVNGEVDTSMDRPLSQFNTEPEYVLNTYTKGLILFDSLRDSVGDRKFFKAIKNYYQDYSFKNVKPEEFIASFIDSTGYDLENFIYSFLNGEMEIQ